MSGLRVRTTQRRSTTTAAKKKATKSSKTARPAANRAPKRSAQTALAVQPKPASDESVRLHPELSRYQASDVKTPSGRKTLDIGRRNGRTAPGQNARRGLRAAKQLGENEKDLRARYAKLNPGMARMSLGNRLRHSASMYRRACRRGTRLETLTPSEQKALSYVLGCIASEADRMRDADPAAFDAHAEAIDQLIEAHHAARCFVIDDEQMAAIRFLVDGQDWEAILVRRSAPESRACGRSCNERIFRNIGRSGSLPQGYLETERTWERTDSLPKKPTNR
jgi:hypothetical protein